MKTLATYLTLLLIPLIIGEAQADAGFEHWKKQYKKRASKRGLSQSFLSNYLDDLSLDKEVLEKYNNQVLLDTKRDYQSFMKKWLRENPSRIEMAKENLKENLELLQKVEKKYGVQKEVIVALWGVETLFGKITGDYDVIRSLSTLAYKSRRKKFYEIQLNAAFRLLKAKHVSREDLKGSWAGATGQCQFMPSNFNAYAQDFDGDGKKDLWNNKGDIFASIANLLKKAGWKKGGSVGVLEFNSNNSNASTIPLKSSPVVIRGPNYKPLMKWNRSSLFAAFNIVLIDGMHQ